VTKFEAAYAKSQLPQLLYNVGLSYMRRYELTKDVADLRRAQSVLTNFRVELERDPTIGSAQNVGELLKQIERSLAAHDTRKPLTVEAEARRATREARPAACPDPAPAKTIVQQADTRRAGAALLTLGGLSLAAGVASGLGFALKGRQFRGELADVTAMQQQACDGDEIVGAVRRLHPVGHAHEGQRPHRQHPRRDPRRRPDRPRRRRPGRGRRALHAPRPAPQRPARAHPGRPVDRRRMAPRRVLT
jgi:hypothetical protein